MRRLIIEVGEWFDRRLQLAASDSGSGGASGARATRRVGFYVFGSAALTVFLLQLVTGILLALIYVPSASEAWNSLQALNHDVTLGWFVRALHGVGLELHGGDRSDPHGPSFFYSAHTNFRENSPGSSACSFC